MGSRDLPPRSHRELTLIKVPSCTCTVSASVFFISGHKEGLICTGPVARIGRTSLTIKISNGPRQWVSVGIGLESSRITAMYECPSGVCGLHCSALGRCFRFQWTGGENVLPLDRCPGHGKGRQKRGLTTFVPIH